MAKREFLVPCVYHFYSDPPVLARGEGPFLFDTEGRRYLDCFSGVTVMNAGHSNPAILDPAIEQLRRLQHTTSVYLTEPVLDLARAVAELTPPGLRKCFFCSSGSEANEGAFQLATLATGRREFVAFDTGLHGRTKAAVNATGLDMWRVDPYPLAEFHHVPGPHDPGSLSALGRKLRSGAIAAVIAEPIQGNGGIFVPPDDYWPRLRQLCSDHGTLLIADEVQTAWNRTGHWFATSQWGVVPDIVTVAKALGNGFPIAAYITTDALASCFTRPAASTFGGNLVSCVAARATLRFHQEHNLGKRSKELGATLRERLIGLRRKHPDIADVRGLGLMIGVELGGDRAAARTDAVVDRMKDVGYLLGKCGRERNVLAVMPPLVVDAADLDRMADALDQTLTQV
jgi:4-aminobutyrate aminotransferase-like enzyme